LFASRVCEDAGVDITDLQHEVEAVSRLYASRHDIERSDDWLVLKLNEEVGELTQAYLARSGQARDRGRDGDRLEADLRAELADVLAQVLLLATRFDIDLADAVEKKWLAWRDVAAPPAPRAATADEH
jgi:NTP pyrophosphatase (non-canonical NTP hydrolase)